jgi:2-hydroxychromene-2-carboxylate isomerase
MSLKNRLMPQVTRLLTSDALRDMRRAFSAVAGKDRVARLYFRVDDPYSWLLAQQLPAFCRRFPIAIEPRVMLGVPDGLYPEPELHAQWARRDAVTCAQLHGLAFPENAPLPAQEIVRAATRVLLAKETSADFLALADTVSRHVWAGDAAAISALAAAAGVPRDDDARALLEQRRSRFLAEGHYLTGTLRVGGEWYWGPDRLDHLAQRLARQNGNAEAADAWGEWRRLQLVPGLQATGEVLEFFFSFRSPYSFIAVPRVLRLARHYGLGLRIRPVLPMVMRGLAVPAAKRLYIVMDTKREAQAAGVPFGRICDPVGAGVERCMAVWPYAEREGKLADFVLNAATAIWSEGIDVAGDAGLARVVAKSGLDISAAIAALTDEGWRARAELNRADMVAAGNWGVPGFRFRGEMFWGQDRIPALEQRVIAAAGASPRGD